VRVNRLDLNQLACLDALLEERNVSRAAERVHLSQPAMSATLARMRDFFGDALLVQVGRSMSLTPFARSLVAPVRDLLMQAQAISHLRPEIDPGRIRREVTVVCSDYVLHVLLASVMRRAETEAPGLTFEVRSIATYLEQELEQGDVDLVVSLATAMISRDHPQETVLRDSFCCIAWEGNEQVAGGLSKSRYLELGHVVTLLGRGRVPTLDQIALDKLGVARRVEVRVPAFSFLPACVVGTRRIATVQTHLANLLAKDYPLRVLPCPIAIDPIVTAAQWHKYQSFDPAIQWVRQALREAALALPSAPVRRVRARRK
jgi:LysR family transcriptional regulator, nod-box dependent transcriptional activator